MMTRAQVEQARARADKATPGPWYAGADADVRSDEKADAVCVIDLRDDNAFIAAARSDVPALAETVDALVEALRHCVEEHDCDEAAAILATYTPPADEPGKE